MSIYGSLAAPDDDHLEECAKWVRQVDGEPSIEVPEGEISHGMITGSGTYGFDYSKECTCGRPDTPLKYQGSHVLPSDEDERGGWVDIACILGHVRYYRDNPNAPVNEEPEWPNVEPFLRFGVNDEKVVLTERNVQMVYDSLGEWLEARKKTKEGVA